MVAPISGQLLQQLANPPNPLSGIGEGIDRGMRMKNQREQSQMRTLQMQQVRQQMQEQEYNMKASVGQAALSEKALKLNPPGEDATSKDWLRYAKAQEAGGYRNAAKSAYGMAEALSAGDGGQLPDEFKSYPEIAKLSVLYRREVQSGNLEAAKEYKDRIIKLKDKANKRPPSPKLESSQTTAINLQAQFKSAGIDIEGTTVQSLGDLSRSLTQRAAPDFNLTQSEINDQIVIAYAQVQAEVEDASAWYESGPFSRPEPNKRDVEAKVIQNLNKLAAEDAGRGVETVTVTEEDIEEALLNKYIP